jgi:hypothetical protein
MKNQLSEHSKKLRKDTANAWQSKKIAEGGYKFTVTLTDKTIAETARNIKNKSEFLKTAIEKLIINKKTA